MAEGERLGDQRPGYRGRIVARADNGVVPWRLREMGFVPGTAVQVLRRGPLGDPVEIELRGYRICLRRHDLTAVYVNGTDPERA